MVLVESPDQAISPILKPWVRVVRQEASSTDNRDRSPSFYIVDIVHIDYFDTFVRKHLLPFADAFSERAIQMGNALIRGGKVNNIENWSWEEVRRIS